MHELLNIMKSAGAAQTQQLGVNRWGTITSVRSTDVGYEVQVMYDYGPDNQIRTGWLPVLTHMVGPSWGFVSPPHQGMQAFVAPDLGDSANGVVLGMAYSTQEPAPTAPQQMSGDPTAVTPGEFCFVSKAGAVLRFCTDGTVYIKTGAGVVIEGPLTVLNDIISTTGNITAQKGNVSDTHGSVDRLRGNYDAHLHTGVQTGTGSTGPTDHNDQE